jgi:glycine/D-amino acid oxidase-like deaminating enzyme/nitrite reductase/ring-hydroxylating ferredoxin subunit
MSIPLHSGSSQSAWMNSEKISLRSPLSANTEADVCIVGAGIAGLSTAYMLAREGKSVVVLDDGPIAGGETERTTAHLVNALDDRYFELENLHHESGARLAADSHTAAIDRIERIVRDENIDCDFERVDGYLFLPPGESEKILQRELEATHRVGLTNVQPIDRAPIDFDTGPALHFPNQGQFHPLKYLKALATAIEKMGGRIFCGTRVVSVEGGDDARVETEDKFVVAPKDIVVATNTPINDRVKMHTKQAAYRTYVVGMPIPRGSVTKGLYWDTAQEAGMANQLGPIAYHYVRLQSCPEKDCDLLIVGGEDHKTGQADDAEMRWARLEEWARERFPMAGDAEYRWSGQVLEPIDGLAFIGRNPGHEKNVFIATGDSGNGMTHGTIAGMLLTDLILGRENKWAELYDPSRKRIKAAGDFAKENLNVAGYYGKWATPGEIKSPSELEPGMGAILRHGLKKIAVYRDEVGELHEMSAVCPHLKCIVEWNPGEKTWDCPCHGSRFNATGEVLNGPAISNLEPLKEKEMVH